jgi:Domain of unknown function (DUF4262)
MCEQCEAVAAKLDTQIVGRGFAVVPVGPSYRTRGWAYSVGLLDARDHPELVVAGWPLGGAVAVLDEMGGEVVAGRRFDGGGPQFGLRAATIGVVPVHEMHLGRRLMRLWHRYYDHVGRFDLELRALQAVLPDADHCFEHQRLQPRLDEARHVRFDGMGPAERRGHRGAHRAPLHLLTPRRRQR